MRDSQFCTPHVVNEATATATVLERLKLEDRDFTEARLQELLYRSPSLLPVGEIERVFGPLIAVARELPTPAGPVDIVYINSEGYLTR